MVGQRLGGLPAVPGRARSRPAPPPRSPLAMEVTDHDEGGAAAAAGGLTIEDFIVERGESLMRLAYLITGQRADAEDLFQETLVDVHRKWSRVQGSDHPYAYVRTMMTNRFTSSRRRKWHGERPTDPVDMPAAADAWFDPSHRVDSDDALWQLLATLPDRMRTVLVLRYFEDLDDSEIADALGIAVSTVRATASRAIAQLRTKGGLP